MLADVHAHGAAAVFAARGRDIVRMYELGKRRRGIERDVFDLAGADPRIWEHLSHLPPDVLAAERARLTDPRLAGPDRCRRAAGRRGAGAHAVRDLLDVREGDGTPVLMAERLAFENWGRTVSNVPVVTAVPRTKSGPISVVRWAAARGHTVRAAGCRHTWSDLFSTDRSHG